MQGQVGKIRCGEVVNMMKDNSTKYLRQHIKEKHSEEFMELEKDEEKNKKLPKG